MGDQEESLRQVRLGVASDPFSMFTLVPLVWHLGFAGRYDEAIVEARRALELYPNHPNFQNAIVRLLWLSGAYEESMAAYAGFWGTETAYYRALHGGYQRGGPAAARRAVADLLAATPQPDPFEVATRYASAGDRDLAFEWLDRALDAHAPTVLHLKGMPEFAALRSDPRYAELLHRMGLPG
jgi:tetratricopeptide (TPR) repeat protein